MADFKHAVAQNVEGRFFVDDSCIFCNLCTITAPEIFEEDKENGWAYVKRQPRTENEIELAYESLEGCPTESIGDKDNPRIEFNLYGNKKWWQFWKS